MRTVGLLLGILIITSTLASANKSTASNTSLTPQKNETSILDAQSCAYLGEGLKPSVGGPPGSMGFDNECCAGLTYVENKEDCDGPALFGGPTGICVACGDRKCDSRYENKCNCSKDCK